MTDTARPAPSRRGLVPRLRAKDPTIWGKADTPELSNRLGWLDLPEAMEAEVASLKGLAATAIEGVDNLVLLGMGGSSLAPEVFASVLGVSPGFPRLTVLDSTHPDQVAAVRARIEPARSLFLVSSKSGTTLETLSGFHYMWKESGGDGRRFIAITDPGTSLEELGLERGFKAVVNAPSEVGGRFSALSHFGLLPAAMIGADLESLLESARAVDWEASVEMGVAWGEAALQGRDKLTLLTSPRLAAYPDWIEQLVAESLGKDDRGVVPVAGEPPPENYRSDRLFFVVRLAGEPGPETPRGQPLITREITRPQQLAGEMFGAEVATSVAGAVLGVNPFDQPDVELAKQRARQALSGESAGEDLVEVGSPALSARLEGLLGSMEEGDYFAIQAYLPMEHEIVDRLVQVRSRIGIRGGWATTAGFGPRFLHSTGQLHKGGPIGGSSCNWSIGPAGTWRCRGRRPASAGSSPPRPPATISPSGSGAGGCSGSTWGRTGRRASGSWSTAFPRSCRARINTLTVLAPGAYCAPVEFHEVPLRLNLHLTATTALPGAGEEARQRPMPVSAPIFALTIARRLHLE